LPVADAVTDRVTASPTLTVVELCGCVVILIPAVIWVTVKLAVIAPSKPVLRAEAVAVVAVVTAAPAVAVILVWVGWFVTALNESRLPAHVTVPFGAPERVTTTPVESPAARDATLVGLNVSCESRYTLKCTW